MEELFISLLIAELLQRLQKLHVADIPGKNPEGLHSLVAGLVMVAGRS